MLEIEAGYQGQVPIFYAKIGENKSKLSRISHSILVLKQNLVLFPAYPPFHKAIFEDLRKLFGPQLRLSKKAQEFYQKCVSTVAEYESKLKLGDFKFKTTPRQHQIDSLLYAVCYPRVGLLLGAGLGKSKIAIDYINYLGTKTLILCPSSLVTNWEGEFLKHSYKPLKVVLLRGTPKRRLKLLTEHGSSADVVVSSYDSGGADYDKIVRNFGYKNIIIDESHLIKGEKSQRTDAALAFSQKAHRRVIMTATMVANLPLDVYTQMRFLSPQIINQDYNLYCNNYVEYRESKGGYRMPVGVKNVPRLNKIIRRHTIKFTKDECLDLLPRDIISMKQPLTPEQKKWIKELYSPEDLVLPEGVISKEHRVVIMQKISQITGGFLNVGQKDPYICDGCKHMPKCVENYIKPYTKNCKIVQKAPEIKVIKLKKNPKLEMLDTLLQNILSDPENKVIVWAKSREELSTIEELLKRRSIDYQRLLKDSSKEANVFNNTPSKRVLLGNIAMGVGFTANAATYMIYFSFSFDLIHYLQSVDRNYRIGQDKKVTVYFLAMEDSIDEQIVEAVKNKKNIADAILNHAECSSCVHKARCAKNKVRQYEPGCIFQPSYERKSIKL